MNGHLTRGTLENVFRRESGRIVSLLARQVGMDHVDKVEDAVQEAMLKALQQWRFLEVPSNPGGWLLRVAKNHLVDTLRRERTFKEKEGEIVEELEFLLSKNSDDMIAAEIEDDQLRMMFVCCHPSLSQESQIALILKILCGLSSKEIARAFLTNEETVHKRLTRAKGILRERKIELVIPSARELPERRAPVLSTLYLLFNEGYNSSHGEQLMRKELCDEAIYLARMLEAHQVGDVPAVHALLAMMLLQRSRFAARLNDAGDLMRLDDQDRALWDRAMISDGLRFLDLSASGDEVTEYHLQAGIAACHCIAKDYESTDWKRILTLYDLLEQINDSPIVSLNRAVAVARVHGPAKGIHAVQDIRKKNRLDGYYLLYAVLGELHLEMRRFEEAAKCYREALRLTELKSERTFLLGKLEVISHNVN